MRIKLDDKKIIEKLKQKILDYDGQSKIYIGINSTFSFNENRTLNYCENSLVSFLNMIMIITEYFILNKYLK